MTNPEVLVFTFPMPENLANSRSHWAVKSKKKNHLWAMADLLVHGKINPKPPKVPWEKATISARMVVGAAMDQDNSVARLKQICDWLKTRGYIADDRRKNLTWTGFPEQRVSRKNTPEVEITLTRIS